MYAQTLPQDNGGGEVPQDAQVTALATPAELVEVRSSVARFVSTLTAAGIQGSFKVCVLGQLEHLVSEVSALSDMLALTPAASAELAEIRRSSVARFEWAPAAVGI